MNEEQLRRIRERAEIWQRAFAASRAFDETLAGIRRTIRRGDKRIQVMREIGDDVAREIKENG